MEDNNSEYTCKHGYTLTYSGDFCIDCMKEALENKRYTVHNNLTFEELDDWINNL